MKRSEAKFCPIIMNGHVGARRETNVYFVQKKSELALQRKPAEVHP